MIVGIDPSLSCTSVIAGNHSILEYSQSFKSKPMGDGVLQRMSRYDELVARVVRFLRGLPKINGIYIEGYSFGSMHGRAHNIGEYGGILRWHLLDFGEVYEVPPSTLKKFATGKGNAKKPIVAASLARRYNLDLESDDEYEGYGCWRLGCVAQGVLKATTEFEEAAAATVRLMKSNVGQVRPQSA